LVTIDGETHLLLYDRDVMYVAEVEEFDEQPAIIAPEKPTIIV
jgi:hypothetical protein